MTLPAAYAHVAIVPPEVLEPGLVKQAAGILDKDPYETRLLLAGKIPRIIAHYQTGELAEPVVRRLRSLGLVVILCTDSELARHSAAFRAHSLKFGDGEVTFSGEGSQQRIIKANDLFLILEGTMLTRSDKETTKTTKKFNLTATIITGGIPVWSKVKVKTGELSFQSEYFVRLYDKTSSDPVIEILQNELDYSFLGTKKASSCLANLQEVVKGLRQAFPAAIFDDNLTEPFTTPKEDVEVPCKVIYLCRRAASS